jgi:PAS domain S-box-containing protein
MALDSEDEAACLFPGESELALRMRALDWATTDLGPPNTWTENLRIAVNICLTSRFPILLWWGPDFTVLYNDACIPFLGETKHPRYLGKPGRECWAEIWNVIGPMLEGVRATGKATWSHDFLAFFARKVPREEVHVRFTFGPILAADGKTVQGIFTPCTEITDEVIGARRLETLRKLGVGTEAARNIDAACQQAVSAFAENPEDIPIAAIYVPDESNTHARLIAAVVRDGESFPSSVSLSDEANSSWPFFSVLRDQQVQEVNLAAVGSAISARAWSDPVLTALVIPISAAAQTRPAGVLVAGVSPRRPLDAAYRTFFDLVAQHVGTAIGDARAFDEERRRADALAELNRAKTAFFSNVSHEFRTPLTLILGTLESATATASDSPGISPGDLNLIRRNSERLLKLVNALLDFSRIEADRMQAAFERTDLSSLTRELASTFQSVVEMAGLRFPVDCKPLPEAVYVDRAMWEKIVLNLISNAFKFTFEGQISISLRLVNTSAVLTVADTGTGIPNEELPRIFDRFYQVQGARGRTHEGSGIGLSLVRELARLHGGSVEVESEYGVGSRFSVSVPLGRAHLAAEQLHKRPQSFTVGARAYEDEALHWLPAPGATPPGRPAQGDAVRGIKSGDGVQEATRTSRPRILVADDNGDMLQHIRRLLAGDYDVETVVDGELALASARDHPPDLILTDVMMPRLDGFGLLRALRTDPRTGDIPIIMLTARADENSQWEGLHAGADDYLVKPFAARELLARVQGRLELARLHREAKERERFIAQMTELMPVVINVFDLDTRRTVYISQHVVDLLGYSPDEVAQMSEPIAVVCHADDIPRIREILDRLGRMADAEVTEIEFRVRRRDGAWIWVTTRMMPFLRTDGGRVSQIVTATMDISSRKRAEEALRISEEGFRRYFELGLIGMAITSPEKGIIEVNDEICRILGYEREELLQKTWTEMTHPGDIAQDIVDFERVMAGTIDGYSRDKRWIRKDGTVIYSTISVKCVRREDRSVDFFVALLQDITARKHAAEALARSHTELERRVAERTVLLTRINDELRKEIAERNRAEAEATALKDTLSGELTGMMRLHEFSTRLLIPEEHPALFEEVLDAIINIQSANFGSIHLYNRETNALEIVAQRGFEPEFLSWFATVHEGEGACGQALRQRTRVIIEDVQKDAGFAAYREIAASSGFRALQCTPLLSRSGAALGIISTHFRQPHRPSERDLRFTDLYAVQAAVMIERTQSEAAVLRYQQELQTLAAKLIEAQEMGSRYLSRDLHDHFSQRLAVLGMNMASLAHQTSFAEVSSRLTEFIFEIGVLAKEIHRTSHQLHPAVLDDLGLAAALTSECAAFSEQHGIPVRLDTEGIPNRVPDDISLCLYRIAQECLRNVGKHAKATEVRVALRLDGNSISMEVSDVGQGFDVDTIRGHAGLGLISMQERARLVGGEFGIWSEPGEGTLVRVHAPLDRDE